VREILALQADSEDLVNIGAYQRGQNPRLDEALARSQPLERFLRQGMDQYTQPEETIAELQRLGAPLPTGGAR